MEQNAPSAPNIKYSIQWLLVHPHNSVGVLLKQLISLLTRANAPIESYEDTIQKFTAFITVYYS